MSEQVYSDKLVSVFRTLDCIRLCAHANTQAFGLDDIEDEDINSADPGGWLGWMKDNIDNLGGYLPDLQHLANTMLQAESTFTVDCDSRGGIIVPNEVSALLQPLIDKSIYVKRKPGYSNVVEDVPADVNEICGNQRVVLWDDDVYLIPDSIPDSFVEVWFPRMFSWPEGDVYPLYLSKRDYGWQAFGRER